MNQDETELAIAAASLTVDDFEYLQVHGMLGSEEAASPEAASQQGAASEKADRRGQTAQPGRKGKRRQVKHEWPEVGTILEVDYEGVHYDAEVIAAPRCKSGRALKILTGPAAGTVHHSMTGSMLAATEVQRDENDLGRKGVANGWDFWNAGEDAQ